MRRKLIVAIAPALIGALGNAAAQIVKWAVLAKRAGLVTK